MRNNSHLAWYSIRSEDDLSPARVRHKDELPGDMRSAVDEYRLRASSDSEAGHRDDLHPRQLHLMGGEGLSTAVQFYDRAELGDGVVLPADEDLLKPSPRRSGASSIRGEGAGVLREGA